MKPLPADAEEISGLYATTWLATYPNEAHGITVADVELKNAERMSPARISRLQDYITNELHKPLNFYVIARDDSRIVGVCTAFEKDDHIQLASIYVLPSEQGKGVGGALMEAFLAWANPHKPVRLHVVSYNQTATRFYERWGFKDTGKRFSEERFVMASGNTLPEIEMVLVRDRGA